MNDDLSWFTVRPIRWCWRLMWSRRMIWTVVCFASLLVLYYQWENWRSAKELAVEHQRMVARFGTDNPVDLARGPVPDAQNYFANPLIQSWAKPVKSGSIARHYEFPRNEFNADTLLACGDLIQLDDGMLSLMPDRWAKHCASKGTPIPSGITPLQSLTSAMGDAHGLLPKLFVGLDLPYSRMIPSDRELAEAEMRDPSEFQLNFFNGSLDFMQILSLHLRTAARNGDAEKTRTIATVMLRFAEALTFRRSVGAAVSVASYSYCISAIQEALAYPMWTDASLVSLARRLGSVDDLETLRHGLADETLCMEHLLMTLRERNGAGLAKLFASGHEWYKPDVTGKFPSYLELLARVAPRGWLDAGNAFFLRARLLQFGPSNEIDWLGESDRLRQIQADCQSARLTIRPLTGIAALKLDPIISVADGALFLFNRRCLIIACALERYRLQHGAFPDTLDGVKSELAALKVNDPAGADQPMRYRLEPSGYLLWSVGPDQNDDGGSAGTDWLWRMKRGTTPQP